MNTYLEALFEKYNFSDKDRYEINQFFSLLPDQKKQNLLNNFDSLAMKIHLIEEEIRIEREILVPDLLSRIQSVMERVELMEFKNEINKI